MRFMWIGIFLTMIILTGGGFIYILSRMSKISIIEKLSKGSKKKAKLISGLVEVAIVVTVYLTMGVWNVMVVFMHLLIFWLICDLCGKLINKIAGKHFETYIAGVVAMLLTIVYLSYGWYVAHHVIQTQYTFTTQKDLGVEENSIRVIGFADSHVGATFHWQGFSEYMDEINGLNPDVVIISGDFVDDDTSKEDMIKCCEALGRLNAKYGVYFVYGNHDKGYYGSSRGYDEADVEAALVANNVNVLRDDIVHVAGDFYILGRLDSQYVRMEMSDYAGKWDEENYVLVLDHEPNDYANEAAAKVDMVISGHTHGGQLIPIIKVGEWAGINDRTYGTETRDNTDFIVTSGISNWALKFKTGCVAEYLVIDIKQE